MKRNQSFALLGALILCLVISTPASSSPTVAFTRFLAGSDQDVANAVAIDSAGNTYVAGYTRSTNFPVVSASIGSLQGSSDAFLTKLSPSGAILFSTYWGGSGADGATGVAVDSTGVYITGFTNSFNFPGQRIGATGGESHAFVSKFSLTGQEIYSLVFGGSSRELVNKKIALDSLHQAYIAGATSSTDFPQLISTSTFHGGEDAFIAKIDSAGNLIASAYVGGSSTDGASGIAVDSTGSVYITGWTSSMDFPHTVPIGTVAGPNTFVTKLNTALSIQYSNVIAGGWNVGNAIWADPVHTYVTGSVGPNVYLPTSPGAFQSASPSPSGFVGFVAELDSTYGGLMYLTYLGGTEYQDFTSPNAIAVQGGNVYVAGYTSSPNFPGAPALTPNPTAGFVSKLSPRLNSLYYTTLLGASITGIAVDLRRLLPTSLLTNVEVYTAGYRYTGTPPPGGDSPTQDAFAVKLVEPATAPSYP